MQGQHGSMNTYPLPEKPSQAPLGRACTVEFKTISIVLAEVVINFIYDTSKISSFILDASKIHVDVTKHCNFGTRSSFIHWLTGDCFCL